MKVRVHMPLPAKLFQVKSVTILDYDKSMKVIDPEDELRRTIYFEDTLLENREFFVEYEYEICAVYHDLWSDEVMKNAGASGTGAEEKALPEDAAECILDLGDVRDWATVYVNGRKVADMWCRPYACDIAQHVKGGGNVDIRVEVVSTWYNKLVHDAGLPKEDRTTWTLKGPSAKMPYCESGLLGPVRLSAAK